MSVGTFQKLIDQVQKGRLRIVLVAVQRFNAFAKLKAELTEARTALAERKLVDRAKAILMESRGMSEADAYALLRTTAMNQSRRLGDIADALITANVLLEGGRK